MNNSPTLRDTLSQLDDEGYAIPDDYENTITGMVAEKEKSSSPWYVRLFVGISAWIAAILFIVFLFMANILQDEESGFILGLIFCAIAVGLNRFGPSNDYLRQLGLALSLTGQILFIVGFASLVDFEIIPTAFGLIVLEIILLWIYQSRLHRIISTLVILGAILAILLDLDTREMVHILIFALAIGLVSTYHNESRLLIAGMEDLIKPVNFGISFFLLGLLTLPLLDDFDLRWWITAVLLTTVLIFLIIQIVRDLGLGLRSGAVPWLLAGCGVLLIPAIRMPGILGALIVLLLGFWRNTRLLVGLSGLFLVFYLSAYYYSLEWTLLVKSFALMGTGVILFLLRYSLLRFAHGGTS